jgi:hypothetical protein
VSTMLIEHQSFPVIHTEVDASPPAYVVFRYQTSNMML